MAQSKAERLMQIRDFLYRKSPQGVSSTQIADAFDLTRSGALKNLRSAGGIWPEIYQDQDKLWYFRASSRLIDISFSPDEVRILHLATRLFSRMMPKGLPDSVSALNKMADASEAASPVSAQWIRETALELEQSSVEHDSDYMIFLSRIHQAMEDQSDLRLKYKKQDGSISSYRVTPLFLEPYGDGRSLYLCARDLQQSRYLTLKTERVVNVRLDGGIHLQNQNSEDRKAFIESHRRSLRQLLQNSWGIWAGSGEREEVVLLFSFKVSDRVKETLWHPSQKIESHEQGLLWKGEISSPLEMYPWIRSWGPEVSVLEPQWLAERHRKDR